MSIKNLKQLTKKEKQIVKLITEGLSNKQITEKIEIKYNTLKTHLNNIYSKLEIDGDNSTKKTRVVIWYFSNKV